MELTPKEKAKEIFGKMYFADDLMDNYPICFKTAKQCALIAQKNLLNKLKELNIVDEFEEEVLFEINAL